MGKKRASKVFTVVLGPATAKGSATSFVVPFDVCEAFGSKARTPVRGTINGFPFRSSVFPVGDGTHYMVVNREVRTGAKARMGDEVRVVMERDDTPRTVDVPADLQAALADNEQARLRWDALSFSHKREYVTAILEAKRPETRQRRIDKAIQQLEAEAGSDKG